MSGSEGVDDESTRDGLRTVTPSYLGRPDLEMDVVGWGMFLILLVIVLPLLPFFVLFWLVSKTIEFLRRQTA